MARRLEMALLCLLVLALAASASVLALRGGRQVELGQYTTSLRGRTQSQRYNATRAAEAIDGRVIKPGEVLSYNETVGPWTADAGYKRAPVSYDGELLSAWGGGVCQTSTTLYNAALLAGLEIVERHRHAWPPKYIAPGRDAAVAYPTIDLVLRNPHPSPVAISAGAEGDGLVVRISGQREPSTTVTVEEDVRSMVPPAKVLQVDARPDARRHVIAPGQSGFDVAVYRVFRRDGEITRRELVSRDHYPAMNRVVQVGS